MKWPSGGVHPRRIVAGTLVHSAGGRRLAYVARSGHSSLVVAHGKRKPRYDRVGYLTLAPDGRRPVYAATRGKEAFTVVDDEEAAHRYESIWMPPGEPLKFTSRTRFHYLAVKNDSIYLVEEELD